MILLDKKSKQSARLTLGMTHGEMKCQCDLPSCRVTLVDEELCEAYRRLRQTVGSPLIITCGYRCQAHNLEVQGSWKLSRHLSGEAVDVAAWHLLNKFKTVEEVKLQASLAGFRTVLYYKTKKFFHFNV